MGKYSKAEANPVKAAKVKMRAASHLVVFGGSVEILWGVNWESAIRTSRRMRGGVYGREWQPSSGISA
jgi:hypothetical protein